MALNLRNLKLMTRLSLTVAAAFLVMLAIVYQSITTMHQQLYEDRQLKTRHLVETAHGVLAGFQDMQRTGTLTEEEAKRQAIQAVKRLRYEEKEYFWIQDLGKPVPRMVMHATVPALDGKVLDEPRFNKATSMSEGLHGKPVPLDNRNLFVAFNDVVERTGHGFVEYQWPKPIAGGGTTKELFMKLSYVKKFEPWGWVIGSGIYIDDVDALFRQHAKRTGTLAILGTLGLLAISLFVRRSIFRDFGCEPQAAEGFTSRIAQGDLTGEIPLREGDESSILFVLSRMQGNLREMLGGVSQNAFKIQRNLESLSSQSNEINLATQLQAGVIEQTRSAITEVSATVAVVNQLAQETVDRSQGVVNRAQEGAKVAGEVTVGMRAISDTISASSAQVTRLVERTREIESMATVIKDIADQTNLLALNAAIEAAHAGHLGKGFAVVADEVRKLSERTGRATGEISQTLQAIQADTEKLVQGMETATPLIESGVLRAGDAADSLRAIEREAEATLGKMGDLAQATGTQSRRIEEIVGNVRDVMAASSKTEAVIDHSLATASELGVAANDLFGMVKRFQIGDLQTADGPSSHAGSAVRPLMEWTPALQVGHSEIDRQHQKLIDLANRLNAAMQAGHGRAISGEILQELVDYTVSHFGFEEGLMHTHAYSDREAHLEEHRKLIQSVTEFKRQFDAGQASVSIELMGFIRDWLVNHILKVDKALARELASRGLA
ncbi:MAG: bacteriohemerythrin [Geothrix sp.]|uniref:bacteriohemerythrin n=1 Tax=Geothrix sp. TaxID=1962974 RepID=UPI0017C6B259|nr:bacteriohemerythrin [Geothrix sp.]NWJ42470.1 bacteriohemerythrin [Geothrix sp.]WIL19567.1 MAG: bacteriohemerythrin [Geothrix sp.]